MQQVQCKHWVIVLAIAIAIHAAVLVRFDSMAVNRAEDPGSHAIRIALAPQPAPEPEPKPRPEAEPQPKPEPAPKPDPTPKPEPESKPESKPAPSPVPDPEPKPTPERQVAAKSSKPKKTVEAQEAAPETRRGGTGGIADAPPDYRIRIRAWLERHKRYPRRARRLGQQGTVVLHFVIDRDGEVLEWELREPSSHRLLNTAVAEMIRRADPMPAMPDTMTVQRLALTVPVDFQLR